MDQDNMKRFITILLLIFCFTLAPSPILARESTTSAQVEDDDDKEIKLKNTESKNQRLLLRQKELTEIKNRRQEELERFKNDKDKLRASLSAEINRRKEEFRLNLAKIKDQRKVEILNRLNEKFARVNKNRTDHWKKVLTRLNEFLGKIKNRRDVLKNSGKDTSSVDVAINNAQLKLDEASVAVNNQADKEYIMIIASASGLKSSAGSVISAETADLRVVQRSIDAAKKAVKDALVALMKHGGDKLNNASPSAQNVE